MLTKKEISLLHSLIQDEAWDPFQDAWEELLQQKGYFPQFIHKDAVFLTLHIKRCIKMADDEYIERIEILGKWIEETEREIRSNMPHYSNSTISKEVLEAMK